MRHKKFFLAALASALLFGSTSVQAADANAFNPYTGKPLPVTRQVKGEEAKILSALGGTPRSIAADAAYRANWKEEIYPILKGSTASRHEVLVVIDFADPKSRQIWQQVARVAKSTPDASARFVLFGKSAELYATDLTGLAIWACRERKGQAIDYVTWAMQRWDSIKQGLKKQQHQPLPDIRGGPLLRAQKGKRPHRRRRGFGQSRRPCLKAQVRLLGQTKQGPPAPVFRYLAALAVSGKVFGIRQAFPAGCA